MPQDFYWLLIMALILIGALFFWFTKLRAPDLVILGGPPVLALFLALFYFGSMGLGRGLPKFAMGDQIFRIIRVIDKEKGWVILTRYQVKRTYSLDSQKVIEIELTTDGENRFYQLQGEIPETEFIQIRIVAEVDLKTPAHLVPAAFPAEGEKLVLDEKTVGKKKAPVSPEPVTPINPHVN